MNPVRTIHEHWIDPVRRVCSVRKTHPGRSYLHPIYREVPAPPPVFSRRHSFGMNLVIYVFNVTDREGGGGEVVV